MTKASTDGRSLWSASEDGSLRRWTAPEGWIAEVCAKLTRNLSVSDWQRLVADVPYRPQCPGLP